MSERLPVLLSPNGEPVELFTAGDLLRSRGIEDLEQAETVDVARFMDDLKHVKSLIAEAEQAASDELIGRLDKRGKWTLEVDGLKVTAPSPDAGTTSYDGEELWSALNYLLGEDVIDVGAFASAVERVRPQPYLKVNLNGVKALLKLPKAREAIEACKVETTPPARKAKVTRT